MKALGIEFCDKIRSPLVSQKASYLEILNQRINLIFSFNSSPNGFVFSTARVQHQLNNIRAFPYVQIGCMEYLGYTTTSAVPKPVQILKLY